MSNEQETGAWMAGLFDTGYSVIFAHGIEPEELLARISGDRSSMRYLSMSGADEELDEEWPEDTEAQRAGKAGEWAYSAPPCCPRRQPRAPGQRTAGEVRRRTDGPRAHGPPRVRATAPGPHGPGADRGAPGLPRPDEPADSPRAGPQREDDRIPPGQRLLQVRHRLPYGTGLAAGVVFVTFRTPWRLPRCFVPLDIG